MTCMELPQTVDIAGKYLSASLCLMHKLIVVHDLDLANKQANEHSWMGRFHCKYYSALKARGIVLLQLSTSTPLSQ